MTNIAEAMERASRVWKEQFLSERDFSRDIARRLKGVVVVENAAAQGTSDLCIPTQTGWLWTELKIAYSGKFLLKKTQHASITAELRDLPERLHRIFWIKGLDGYASMTVAEVMASRKRPTERGLWVTIPDDVSYYSGLDDLLAHFGCLHNRPQVV